MWCISQLVSQIIIYIFILIINSTARLWGVNSKKCIQTHVGHKYDTNSVLFLTYGSSFETVSDETTFRLFNMIFYGAVKKYHELFLIGIKLVVLIWSGGLLYIYMATLMHTYWKNQEMEIFMTSRYRRLTKIKNHIGFFWSLKWRSWMQIWFLWTFTLKKGGYLAYALWYN